MVQRFSSKYNISNNSIIKLSYKRESFDFSVMKTRKLIVTITENGSVVFREYIPGSRKTKLVYKGHCSANAYEVLCIRIEDCIATADRQDYYCDDASEELKIFHKFGRVQIIDRGLGNSDINIEGIMHDFLKNDIVFEN